MIAPLHTPQYRPRRCTEKGFNFNCARHTTHESQELYPGRSSELLLRGLHLLPRVQHSRARGLNPGQRREEAAVAGLQLQYHLPDLPSFQKRKKGKKIEITGSLLQNKEITGVCFKTKGLRKSASKQRDYGSLLHVKGVTGSMLHDKRITGSLHQDKRNYGESASRQGNYGESASRQKGLRGVCFTTRELRGVCIKTKGITGVCFKTKGITGSLLQDKRNYGESASRKVSRETLAEHFGDSAAKHVRTKPERLGPAVQRPWGRAWTEAGSRGTRSRSTRCAARGTPTSAKGPMPMPANPAAPEKPFLLHPPPQITLFLSP
jgi:hypothetical protein